METGQRHSTRHGLPRLITDARSRRADRVARDSFPASQSPGPARAATGDADRHHAAQRPGDWERMYSHPVYFAETFIDPGRFRGTCYRAANWVLMGRTTGRGKASNSYIPNRSIKEVLGLALTPRFRELLSE